MEIPGKGVTNSLDLRTKMSNKKQRERFAIIDITKQDFRKLLNCFEHSPYIGYKSKHVYNEPTEAYLFLIKQITKLMKNEKNVQLRTNFFESDVKKNIVSVNEKMDTSTNQYTPRN